eukprot:Nk52_evm7s229 gene=Nk52_evmTU7s229
MAGVGEGEFGEADTIIEEKSQSQLQEKRKEVQEEEEEDLGDFSSPAFVPRTHVSLTRKEVDAMPPVERGKYLAYEPPVKEAADLAEKCARRLHKEEKKIRNQKKQERRERMERLKINENIGALTSKEAEERVTARTEHMLEAKASELEYLIASQPTSLCAVKLASLVPFYPTTIKLKDTLSRKDRLRVRDLMENGIRD